MIPNGFDDALRFKNTLSLPLGSWRCWLAECFYVVETKHKFACSWATLVGMSVAMMELQPATRVEFRQAAMQDYNRSQHTRFLVYFVAMIDALSGASYDGMASTYRGKMFDKHRATIPFGVLEWPHSDSAAAINTSHILKAIQPLHVSYPLSRETDADFYANLLYGYYAVNGDERVLPMLYAEYKLNEQCATFSALLAHDERLRVYFNNEWQREKK